MEEQSAKYQYLAAFVVNFLMTGYGVTCGWTSPAMSLLTTDETPLKSGKLSMAEASWIASLLCIGGLFGNFFFGFITNLIGRKKPLLIMAIPAIVSWSLVYFAQNVYWLYAARLLNGVVGGGIFAIVPLFLAEIANDRVRGILGSTLIFTGNIGILLGYTIGTYCDFNTTPIFVISLTILFVIIFPFFPESPSYLIKQDNSSATEKSIRFYQNMLNKGGDHELLQFKMDKLKNTIGGEKTNKDDTSLKLADFTTKTSRKALIIGIVLAALNQLSGCFPMLSYTAHIFQMAGSNLAPNTSAIVVGVIQLIGSSLAAFLVDRAGRKFLYLVSTVGTALGFITLGVYVMLKSWHYNVELYNWIPIASFSFLIFIASWGILTLPFLVIAEVMPEKLKNFGVSLCMTVLWIMSFFMTKYLPLLIELLGLHGSMFLFAGVCLSAALFILLIMPETKGKTHEQIMKALQ